MGRWLERYGDGGVCDFKMNYDFYFKYLINKIMQLIVIRGAEDTKINVNYLKQNLILDGDICITDYDDSVRSGAGIYAVSGNLGGEPDEYYIPVRYVTANPILGSKEVYRKDWEDYKQNGVVIFNTDVDSIGQDIGPSRGLYDLISQTATLLADNIVSINCQQINSRVQAFFTADGEAQAVEGEAVLKRMYAGSPYQILRSDIVDKLTVNPMSNTGTANNITQLVELNNYILANFFQNIGVKANDLRKKERLITAEINEQDDMVQLSLTEMVTSWEKGFLEVNKLYGTDLHAELNPILVKELANEFIDVSETVTEPTEETSATVEADESVEEDTEETVEVVDEEETEVEEQEETPEEIIEEVEEVANAVIDSIIDEEGGDNEDEPSEELEDG